MANIASLRTHFKFSQASPPKQVQSIEKTGGSLGVRWERPVDTGGANVLAYNVKLFNALTYEEIFSQSTQINYVRV